MKKSYYKRALLFHIKDHLSIFIFIMVLYLMGIIFGAIIVNSLSLTQKEDLSYYLSQFFGELKQSSWRIGFGMATVGKIADLCSQTILANTSPHPLCTRHSSGLWRK